MIIKFADLFCGAGGTSTGAMEAIDLLGYRAEMTAINHWPVAIATHKANHPEAAARTHCTSVDEVNPRALFRHGDLDLFWASPECTHHSNARGSKPINEQSRATAFCVPRWMDAVEPEVVLVENVPEFRKWGRNKDGKTFEAWFQMCLACGRGYHGAWQDFCAADYGDPTTRERMFVMFVRKYSGRKIVWPQPTHSEHVGSQLKPWVPAREIIDWSLPGASIYDRKKPLSQNTLRRIMVGLERFGLGPFIVPGQGDRKKQRPRTHGVNVPAPTVCATGHLQLVEPFLVKLRGTGTAATVRKPSPTVTAGGNHLGLAEPFLVCMEHGGRVRAIDRPTPTITCAKRGALGVAEPFLVQVAHGNGAKEKNGDTRRVKSTSQPLGAVTGSNEWGVCEPAVLGQQSGSVLRPVSQPVPTLATTGAVALVEPFLVEYYGQGSARKVSEPVATVTTHDRFGLVRPVVMIKGKRYVLDIRFRMLQPHELAAAQGFRRDYIFYGSKKQGKHRVIVPNGRKEDVVKQIGNAVPRNLARALVLAALSQQSDIRPLLKRKGVAA